MARRWGLRPGDFWRTPPWLVAAISLEFDLRMDVSASEEDSVCEGFLPPERSGLEHPWEDVSFWNPPYSPGLLPWTEKAVAEAARGVRSIGLIPPSTDAAYMTMASERASVITFLRGRVPFLHPDTGRAVSGNRGGSCLVYFDEETRIASSGAEVRWVNVNELRRRGEHALAALADVPHVFPGSAGRLLRTAYSSALSETCCVSRGIGARVQQGSETPIRRAFGPNLLTPKGL